MAGPVGASSGRAPAARRFAAGAAAMEAQRLLTDQRQRRNRSLVRHGVGLLLVLAFATALYATREEAHPARPEAVALSAAFDATFTAVAGGELELTPTPRPVGGSTAATVVVGERTLGVATGEAGGECYAHWWDAQLVRHSRVLADGIPCEPATIVTSIRPVHVDRLGPIEADAAAAYPWERIIPGAVRQRLWFLPVMAVIAGVALSLMARIVTTAVTGRTPAELTREERRRKA